MEAIQGKSFLSWVGGKSRLSSQIIPLMPEHQCYCEVFGGAGWVLFKKPESKAEVLNDFNRDLVTLYRVIQNHLEEFLRYFKWVLVSRDEFERLNSANADSLTDIQRAARFYYLVKTSFGSRVNRPTLGTSTTSKPRLNLLRLEEDLSAAHLRLSRVQIENLPYAELIRRYDRKHTLFYIDPPYYGCEDYYGDGMFSRDDFIQLRDQLGSVKGKFILSINDHPDIRNIFGQFVVREVSTRYSVGHNSKNSTVNELLFMNYDPGK